MARATNRVRALLGARGISVASVARLARVSPSTASRHLEQGTNTAVCRAAAKKLGVKAAALWPKASADASGVTVQPAHEGATTGRRLGMWGLSQWGPNAAALSSLRSIRSRARELIRNDGWATRGKQMLVKELVGTGIMPIWRIPGNPELARELRSLFKRWTDECDADGTTDWAGQQSIVASELVEAGECIARDRPRRASDGLVVPYQVQALEPDFLDETYTTIVNDSRSIRMGIEFDARGKRLAYHLFRSHPGDIVPMSGNGDGGFDRVAVPADSVRHVYHIERAGLIRGLPWLSPVILRLYELSQYDDAQLLRQKLAAMFTGHLVPDPNLGAAGYPGTDGGTNPMGQQIMDWEPGMFSALPPGFGEVKFSEPPDPGAHFDEFTKWHLRAFASGIGPVLFEQISNNAGDMNLSTIRAMLQDVRELAEMITWKTIIFQFCRPTLLRWMEAAVLSGAVKISDYFENRAKYTDVSWIPPKKAYSDPLKDWAADIMSIRAGLRAPQDVILARGEDPDEVLEKIAEWNAKLEAKKIISDANPGQTGQGGRVQSEAILASELGTAATTKSA